MKNDWFSRWFNTQEYLDLYKHRDDHDAQKVIDLIFNTIEIPENGKVLDLACGNGRHSILFARKNLFTTGIDLSPYLISKAEERKNNLYRSHKDYLQFEVRDMRDLKHNNEFDLIVNLFSSFGYFKKDEENEQVIKCVSDALVKDGFFVIDFLNPEWTKNHLTPFDVSIKDGNYFAQVRTVEGKFVHKKIYIRKENKISEFEEYIRLFDLNNFRIMFDKHALSIMKVYGDYTGSDFESPASSRMIIIAQKKA